MRQCNLSSFGLGRIAFERIRPGALAPATSGNYPSISNLNRIGEHSIWAKFGSGRYEGSRDVTWPENVKDSLAGGDQIIRNDPPVTSPP